MYGTLTTFDTIESRFQYAGSRVADLGEQRAYEAISELLADHNAIMRQMVADLADYTTERDAMYGGGDTTGMMEVDEMGTAPPSKILAGSVVGFPLRRFEKAWQGTKKWLERATMGEMVAQVQAMKVADRLNIIRQIKLALFTPTNYTFLDTLTDRRTNPLIAVKALVNADSMPIPPGPNGETFDASTHTHYLGTASFAASDVSALIQTVLEHFGSGEFILAIARGQEAAIRAMTPNFVASLPAGIVGATNAVQIPGMVLPNVPLTSRVIGEFDGIPVAVKPWMPSGYLMCYDRSAKPIMIRVEPGIAGAGDLQIDAQDEDHPLRADTYSREFGVGVYTRTGAAILDSGHSSYTAPTI